MPRATLERVEASRDGYSIWWFLAAFILMGGIGLFMVLRVDSDSPTIDISPPSTLPAATTPSGATAPLEATRTPDSSSPPEAPPSTSEGDTAGSGQHPVSGSDMSGDPGQ